MQRAGARRVPGELWMQRPIACSGTRRRSHGVRFGVAPGDGKQCFELGHLGPQSHGASPFMRPFSPPPPALLFSSCEKANGER